MSENIHHMLYLDPSQQEVLDYVREQSTEVVKPTPPPKDPEDLEWSSSYQ